MLALPAWLRSLAVERWTLDGIPPKITCVTDSISRKTRNLFRDYLVSYTLGEIDMVFGVGDLSPDLGYAPPNIGGQRRTRVEQYYFRIDWSDAKSIGKVQMVFEAILLNLDDALVHQPDWDAGKDARI